MKKWEKEISARQIQSEYTVVSNLNKTYKEAIDDINAKILELDAREQTQSVIYQKKYQKALKQELTDIYTKMSQNWYANIDSYLTDCYENSFYATMYSLHNEGIPVIIPINQVLVSHAESQDFISLSKILSQRIHQDVADCANKSLQAITKGFATGSGYGVIASEVAKKASEPLSNALRIVRTEGHRIQEETSFKTAMKVKENGADLVKQWSSAIDARTRDTHLKLDGQIREMDQPFKSPSGATAMFPSAFHVAHEDINCRCRCLTRARWALDESEMEKYIGDLTDVPQKKLEEIADKLGVSVSELITASNGVINADGSVNHAIKANNLNDFKKKYQKRETVVQRQIEQKAVAEKLDATDFSDAFLKGAEKKNTKAFVDYVNSLEGADADVIKLYKSIGKLENYDSNGISFKISHAEDHQVAYRYFIKDDKLSDVKLVIPKLDDYNLIGQAQTTLHEEMHLIDLMLKENPTKRGSYFSASNQKVIDAVRNTSSDIGTKVKSVFASARKDFDRIADETSKLYQKTISELKQQYIPNGVWGAGADYKTYDKLSKKAYKDYIQNRDVELRNAYHGVNSLEDIYDALSKGTFRDNGTVKYGHGSKYYLSLENQIDEITANYGALKVSRPDLIDLLKEDKPELCKALDEMIGEMLEKVEKL